MRLAVIQHRVREIVDQDIDALAVSVERACSMGAHVIVCPAVPFLVGADPQARDALFERLSGCLVDRTLLLPSSHSCTDTVMLRPTPLGYTALLLGDECVDPALVEVLSLRLPQAIVMRPQGESELQAEAFLEHALGLSASLAGLVVVCECVGAAAGCPGHGGSAVAILGQFEAEATSGEEIIMIDLDLPVSAPEPREDVPALPPILEQRLAHHQGRKADVDYPADLS